MTDSDLLPILGTLYGISVAVALIFGFFFGYRMAQSEYRHGAFLAGYIFGPGRVCYVCGHAAREAFHAATRRASR